MSIETFRQVQGRRVIASDSAEPIGSVKGFVLEPGGRRIEAIHVDGKGKTGDDARVVVGGGVRCRRRDGILR